MRGLSLNQRGDVMQVSGTCIWNWQEGCSYSQRPGIVRCSVCPREDLGRKASGRGEAKSALGDIGKNSVSRFTKSASGHREKASDLLSSVCTLWWALHGLRGYIWASGGPRDAEGRTNMYRTCVTNFFCVSLGRQTRINLLSLGLPEIHLLHLRVVWTYRWWSEHPMLEVDTSLQGGVQILECNINVFSLS